MRVSVCAGVRARVCKYVCVRVSVCVCGKGGGGVRGAPTHPCV